MLVALLLLLVLLGILVVALTGSASAAKTDPSVSQGPPPRASRPLQLPPVEVELAEPPPAGCDDPTESTPSPTLTIPLGPGALSPNAYVLQLAHSNGGWRVTSLEPEGPEPADRAGLDTLTLTVVVPWRDLERDYRWLKVVLR